MSGQIQYPLLTKEGYGEVLVHYPIPHPTSPCLLGDPPCAGIGEEAYPLKLNGYKKDNQIMVKAGIPSH